MEMALSIVAIVLSMISGGFAIYSFFWTARRNQKQATLDAYNILQEQALDVLNEYTETKISGIIESNNREEYRKLSKMLARIEHFSVGVNSGIYDKTTVFELAHGYFDIAIWYKLQPLLAEKHKGKGEEYYSNYRQLVAWMQRRGDTK
jgi:hypothetical protein